MRWFIMKKLFSVIAAVVLSLNVCFCAGAETQVQTPIDNGISPCYLYTKSISSQLIITSKTAYCSSEIIGQIGTTTKIVVNQVLQKKSGSQWNKVIKWSKTVNSNVCHFSNTASVSSGTYRVKTVAKVYKGTKYETIKHFSTKVSC